MLFLLEPSTFNSMFLQGQQVVLPYDHPEYIPVPAGPIHLMTLHQYVNFGQVFVPTWWEHNPTFPLEISGLLIGNMGGFLPKDPRWMELQEKRHYHNWIIQLTRQAAALEDRETVGMCYILKLWLILVNNWYRLQYLHSGEKPWQEGDFLQGATRPNDLSLPHVVNNLNGCIRKMACHQMQGVHGLTEHIGKTVQMLNKVTYIMNGRYCSMPVQPPPALPPPEVSITNPSSSSPQQSPSNNSSRPVPTAERAVVQSTVILLFSSFYRACEKSGATSFKNMSTAEATVQRARSLNTTVIRGVMNGTTYPYLKKRSP